MDKIKILNKSQVVDISNKDIYTHTFQGHNMTNQAVHVSKKSASCSCTAVDLPEVIKPLEIFDIKVSVNKLNQSGIYSVFLTLDFEGETHTLRLSGSIKS